MDSVKSESSSWSPQVGALKSESKFKYSIQVSVQVLSQRFSLKHSGLQPKKIFLSKYGQWSSFNWTQLNMNNQSQKVMILIGPGGLCAPPEVVFQCVAGHCYYRLLSTFALLSLFLFLLRLFLLTHFRETHEAENLFSPIFWQSQKIYAKNVIFFSVCSRPPGPPLVIGVFESILKLFRLSSQVKVSRLL